MVGKRMLALLLSLIVVLPLSSNFVPTAAASPANSTPPSIVKLWEVDHRAYMAKFVGEEYVVVFESHGDVSLDGKYIGVMGSGRSLYVYRVSTGELVGKLTSDTDDSWGDTWETVSYTHLTLPTKA